MSESELVRDLVQEGIRQAMQLEALKNIRFLIKPRTAGQVCLTRRLALATR
jgi:hypothetical protein